ncbi:hypothetical protein CICLE_v10017536mg [Citrus x clementina]|uniref:Uncharacterized protein n=1 Tax=Citrus clementina TaxID=85681 RepID=V4TP45_CITCL|nr:uncharacterized protein LOC18051876 [Citrus x clementina]ESR62273.1 hypothetical protein CICLE_v10017536mg [Citrus x clementina]
MTILRRNCGYSKIDKEDPEEVSRRRAQFLIYKVLVQADSRRKPSFIRIRLCKLKIKIGKRLRKLRKSMLVSISAARIAFYKQLITQLTTWRRFFGQGETIASLPPLFN